MLLSNSSERQECVPFHVFRVPGDEMLTEAQAGYIAGRFSVLELADAYAAWRDARLRGSDLATDARRAELDLGREIGRSLRELDAP